MKRCPHEGPHYRSVPKGQIGPWLCKDCLAQTEHEPDAEVVQLAETLQSRPDASERGLTDDLVARLRLALKVGLHPELNLLREAADEIERLRAQVGECQLQRDAHWIRANQRTAELADANLEYETLVGLLRRRFPQRADGNMPDYKIEDVLVENERLRDDTVSAKLAMAGQRTEIERLNDEVRERERVILHLRAALQHHQDRVMVIDHGVIHAEPDQAHKDVERLSETILSRGNEIERLRAGLREMIDCVPDMGTRELEIARRLLGDSTQEEKP